MLPPATGRHHPLISRYNKYGNHGPSAPGTATVFTVKTDKGEYILDNQTDDVVLWSNTGYRFVKRQSRSDPNARIALGDRGRSPLTASHAQEGDHQLGHVLTRPQAGWARPAFPGRTFWNSAPACSVAARLA
jgi:hypothetical protein